MAASLIAPLVLCAAVDDADLFKVVAVADTPPQLLYTPPDANNSERVDLDLQKMARCATSLCS